MTTDKEAARVDAWQPIETAPKDGTWLLTFSPQLHARGYKPEIIYWLEGRWVVGRGSTPYHSSISFTHWTPLPAPPAQGGEGERT